VIATAGVGAGRELVVPAADAPDLWDPWERHRAEAQVRARLVERWIRAGVRFDAPERALLDLTVTLSPGARVGADVTLSGRTEIGPDAVIGQGAALHDTTVGEGAEIKPYTVATGAVIGPRCAVGPFAHLREGAVLEADVKVGNFVEVKKAVLRQGAKASHLSYLGDAEIGPGANVGAGTITCNYDGFSKHRTEIGAGAFIGSNTALVAPVAVGAGAIVGAGSVITRDVPADALAVERTPQRNLEGMAAQLRARNARKKESR
jgi:bifunctional UDP-N-acetylglucosamine pyrophosphorylase/glucosamine-1-phosphate N-acetyltransferase